MLVAASACGGASRLASAVHSLGPIARRVDLLLARHMGVVGTGGVWRCSHCNMREKREEHGNHNALSALSVHKTEPSQAACHVIATRIRVDSRLLPLANASPWFHFVGSSLQVVTRCC